MRYFHFHFPLIKIFRLKDTMNSNQKIFEIFFIFVSMRGENVRISYTNSLIELIVSDFVVNYYMK